MAEGKPAAQALSVLPYPCPMLPQTSLPAGPKAQAGGQTEGVPSSTPSPVPQPQGSWALEAY